MRFTRGGYYLFILIALCFVTGALVYHALPAQMATHWDAAGRVNGTMGRFWGTFLVPFMMLGFGFIWFLLPLIDPLRENLAKFRPVYDLFWFLIVAFMAYLYAITLGINLGWHLNIARAFLPAYGIFVAVIGILLRYTKRNWFIGIRTPWTLSSDTVWTKTHRVGSGLFVTAGVVIFVCTFVGVGFVLALITPLALAAVISIVYSYFAYASEQRQSKT